MDDIELAKKVYELLDELVNKTENNEMHEYIEHHASAIQLEILRKIQG